MNLRKNLFNTTGVAALKVLVLEVAPPQLHSTHYVVAQKHEATTLKLVNYHV